MTRTHSISPGIAVTLSSLGISVAATAIGWMLMNGMLLPPETLFVMGTLSFMLTFFSWASVDQESFRRSTDAYNRANYVAIGLFVIVMILQWNKQGQPFPAWATAVLCIVGLTTCAVTAYLGVQNFGRWMRGDWRFR